MTIEAIENHTKVMTPTGHEGRVKVTRRERKLISDNKLQSVSVLGKDGLVRLFPLAQLELIEDAVEVGDE